MLQLLLLTVLTVTVYTTDIKQRLEIHPAPVEGFNLDAFLGQWFIQFRRAPCTWPGSSVFTDYEQHVMSDGNKGLFNRMTWRSGGMCNSGNGRFLIAAPGVFTAVDNIVLDRWGFPIIAHMSSGDSYSGRLMVAAIDYKKFVIYWGCTKMSATGDRCEEPWMSVATRLRFPSPMVVNMIENILRTRWGITIGELQKIPHKKPCRNQCKY